MKPHPAHRLPAPLEAAAQRLKQAAREAVERTIESLGLAALSCGSTLQRDSLLGAQFELNRKSAVFVLAFNDAWDERLLRELGRRDVLAGPEPGMTTAPASAAAARRPVREVGAGTVPGWNELSLVDDREVEAQISADRFGMEIAHACEWELRELDPYVQALLRPPTVRDGDDVRPPNPLRPDLLGHALRRGVDAVSDRADVRQVLGVELGRSLGALLRTAYGDIVADMRRSGVTPAGLAVRHGRQGPGRGAGAPGEASRAGAFDTTAQPAGPGDGVQGGGQGGGAWTGREPVHGGASWPGGGASRQAAGATGGALGYVDPALMSLIRRLAHSEGFDTAGGKEPAAGAVGRAAWHGGSGSRSGLGHDGSSLGGTHVSGHGGDPLPNLIRAHRDALRQAATGSLDHMVIDVVGSLFDQILSDPKVPPQIARQIARLQLPVLRAALGDASFFTSRRHPVRRFINRIASLGAALDDFAADDAQRLLAKVRALVQEVVEGDFDQIATYEQRLESLEDFVAELSRSELRSRGDAAELLAAKEDELRLMQVYAQRLEGELKDLAGPEFVREFIAGVWSRVLMRAATSDGEESERVRRFKRVGRDLFISVQPKATPAQRKAFLGELPQLMQDLTEGMNLIGWPEAQRRAFFGQLMPAHAEALRTPGLRTLDINLMARRVDGVLERPLPSADEVRALPPGQVPVLTEALSGEIVVPSFSAEERRRVGLVDEAAVDWSAPLDIDLGALGAADVSADTAADTAAGTTLTGAEAGSALGALPSLSEPAEPIAGVALADAVQVGFAYQMHLQGQWQKVRLSHVSPARSFFVFTHGARHPQTVSLTKRMLLKLCEAGRLRAYESAYLLERATARARQQLAALGAARA
jgi:hypothetical protein